MDGHQRRGTSRIDGHAGALQVQKIRNPRSQYGCGVSQERLRFCSCLIIPLPGSHKYAALCVGHGIGGIAGVFKGGPARL